MSLHDLSTAVALLAVLALAFGPGSAFAADQTRILGTGSPTQMPELRVLSQDERGISVEFELPTVTVEDLTAAGSTWQLLSIPGGGETGDVGSPLLPAFTRLVLIPDRSGVQVSTQVIEESVLDGFHLIPVQDEEGAAFSYDQAAYARDGFGDQPLARAGSPALMRGLRVVNLTFTPVQYNPVQGTLRVVRRVRVDVRFAGEDLANVGHGRPESIPPSFDEIYRQLIIGYDPEQLRLPVEDGSYLVICANNAQVLAALQPLLTWRQRQGNVVRLATTAETGTSKEAIKAYIQNAYNTWSPRPETVVLCGDADGAYAIPTWYYGGGEGDFSYTRMDGNDLISDVHIGRLSFSTIDELNVIVAKTVNYESAPLLSDPGWFTRACLVGDASHSGISTIQVMQWIKTRLRQIGYTQIDTIFGGNFVSQMTTALNQGDTFLAYRGYYGFSGWSNSNTYALTNYNKLPFAVISTCGTGSFASGTSNSEAFLRAGTVSQPKGAVGSIGTSTLSTHTRYNNCLTMGVYHSLIYENRFAMGEAFTRGKYELYLNYIMGGASAVEDFCTWNNLMGDPGCEIWTALPTAITAVYPDTVPVGSNSFTIAVSEAGGGPCAGARVCLWKGTEVFVSGRTDENGVVELPIQAASAGTMKLTVTKHNRLPLLADVPVAAENVFVSYLSSAVSDNGAGGSAGNGDGQPNPGETISFGVTVENFGILPAADVQLSLATSDPYVSLSATVDTLGTLDPGATATGAFVFTIDPTCPHNHKIHFEVDATSGADTWHSTANLTVLSARLAASTVTVYDPINQKLDPGESRAVSIRLRNQGALPASGVVASVTTEDPWISIMDGSGSYGDIPMGGSADNSSDRYMLYASPSTFNGHLAVLRIVTSFNSGLVDTSYATITVGIAAVTDPTGPDAYGYYAFDSGDTAYDEAPVYNWIELNPTLGGDGTQVPLGDLADGSDRSLTVDMPFPFKFYGQDFTKATICSNGWLSMGSTYLTDYRNWTIPGAGSPQNLIAVFWDELRESNTGNGHVYQKYDAANHTWIVEWSQMRNGYNTNVIETFEAILYDPEFYPTLTGDGVIVFQYNTLTNIDSVDGYATVGLQNWNQSMGILYNYWNSGPATAAPLAAGLAVKFSPSAVDPAAVGGGSSSTPRLALGTSLPNPFAAATTLTFSLEKAGHAVVSVYDVQGRSVRRLAEGNFAAGPHVLQWDGRDDGGRTVPAGIYFSRLQADGGTRTQRVIRVQ